MNAFCRRTLTGVAYGLILVSGIVIHPVVFSVVFLFLTIVLHLEFYRMAERAGSSPQRITGLIAGILIFLGMTGFAAGLWPLHIALLPLLMVPVVFVAEIYRASEQPIPNIASTLMGYIYVAIPMSLTSLLVFQGEGASRRFYPWIMLGMMLTIWAFDSGAYLIGTAIGKHRLFERISPKKSWEGVLGGGTIALFTGVLNGFLFPEIELKNWLVISIIVVVAGTYGDLIESLLKRSLQIKDSGNSLPGHGGFLDRLDSFLLVVPFVLTWLLFFPVV